MPYVRLESLTYARVRLESLTYVGANRSSGALRAPMPNVVVTGTVFLENL